MGEMSTTAPSSARDSYMRSLSVLERRAGDRQPAKWCSTMQMSPPEPRFQKSNNAVSGTASVQFQGSDAIAVSPEGVTPRVSIDTLLKRIAPVRMDSGGVVLPDGVRTVIGEGPLTIWVHEFPPRVHCLRRIAADSPAPLGERATCRTVRLALPYLVVFAVFMIGPNGNRQLSGVNEAFFLTEPLKSVDDKLCYPALLDCSEFDPPDGRPLSWICAQHLRQTPAMMDPDPNVSLRAGFLALMRCMLETGFNLSSERHKSSSWYTESCRVDKRLNPVERWQAASDQDPLFVLDVPWLQTGLSVRDVANRICRNASCQAHRYDSAEAIARLVFQPPPHAFAAPSVGLVQVAIRNG